MEDAQEPRSDHEGSPSPSSPLIPPLSPPVPPHTEDVPPQGESPRPAWGSSWPPPPPPSYQGWGSSSGPDPEGPNPYGGPPVPPGTWSDSWSSGWPPDAGAPPPPTGAPGSGWDPSWASGGDPARPRRTLPSAITVLLLAVAVLVGLGLGHSVWRSGSTSIGSGPSGSGSNNPGFEANPFGNNNGGGTGSSGASGSSGAPSNTNAIAAQVSPDLVDIATDLTYENGEAFGTGIVLTPGGLVLTNNHVISGATRLRVTDVGNHETYTGSVVGYDRAHDVALVQLQDANGLRTATIGNSSRVSVGDGVVGLGNAGGLGGTPASAGGTVTALDQSITATDEGDGSTEQLTGLIQVNADIQPGDSGGALVDSSGRVIGIDTAASAGFNFQTAGDQGFAIPINQAGGIVRQIQAGQSTGTVHIGPTAFLGVLVSTSGTGAAGATLTDAVPGGPAAAAGLTGGDTITSLAGHSVDKASTLTNLILSYHPGQKVVVGWSDRDGQAHDSTVTLVSGPAQ